MLIYILGYHLYPYNLVRISDTCVYNDNLTTIVKEGIE